MWLDAPGFTQLKVFKEIFTSLEAWWDLVPDQTLYASGEGSDFNRNTAARSANERWMLAYLSEPATVSIRLDAITSSRQVEASWINTTNGNRLPVGRLTTVGPIPFTTPKDWEDSLLLVEAVE